MSRISDFPDEPKYTIKNVCHQTGILPVTLRAWERRYEVLIPHRSDNRYRLYSERDVAVLRWIKGRVDEGVPIRNAATELRAMLKKGLWPEAVSAAPVAVREVPAAPPKAYANQLYEALIVHDEARAGEVFRQMQADYDLDTLCGAILAPCLVAIGEAWYHGKIRVTTEHFASAYIRGKLLSFLQAYPARRSAPHLLIGCAPDEQHEMGSLMLAVLLRSRGYRVEYLGPDLPLDDVVDYAGFEKPDMVIFAATMPESAVNLTPMQEKLQALRPSPRFGYGGRAFDLSEALRSRVQGSYLGAFLGEAVASVEAMFRPARPGEGSY